MMSFNLASLHQNVGQAPLNQVLLANASFSALSGAVMLIAATSLANLMGGHDPLIYRMIGAGLILFAADIAYSVSKGVSFGKGFYFVLGDFGWVAGSALLLFFWPETLSPIGRLLVAGIATIVLVFGSLQDFFILKAYRLRKLA